MIRASVFIVLAPEQKFCDILDLPVSLGIAIAIGKML
jgi:hypothetical protein